MLKNLHSGHSLPPPECKNKKSCIPLINPSFTACIIKVCLYACRFACVYTCTAHGTCKKVHIDTLRVYSFGEKMYTNMSARDLHYHFNPFSNRSELALDNSLWSLIIFMTYLSTQSFERYPTCMYMHFFFQWRRSAFINARVGERSLHKNSEL